MKIPRTAISQVIEFVLQNGAKKATKYLSENDTVKATFFGKRDARSRTSSVMLTIGRPNYAEREFIKKCKKVGEPFPVKKVQTIW